MQTRNNFRQSNREIDENGYLTVHDCLLLRNGIMEYSGEELINGSGSDVIDGVTINPKKIYRLNITTAELEKAKDSFKLAPIVNGHTFLGKDGENPKDFQEGAVGENLTIVKEIDEDGTEKDFLKANLKFTNPDTIELITNGEKQELSTSYTNDLKRSNNEDYDFEVINIVGNHLALVNKGRAGSKVRVANNNEITNNSEAKMKKLKNEMVEEVKEKETETKKEELENEENKEEKELEVKNEAHIDKRKLIDEIGGILKDKLDEELWRTVIKKVEKIAYSGSERTEADNAEEDKKEEKATNEKSKACNELNSLKEAMYDEIKARLENENKNLVKAYNEVKTKTGDFNFYGLSEADVYRKGFENSNIQLSGNETLGELKAMFRVYNSIDKSEEFSVFQPKSNLNLPKWCK